MANVNVILDEAASLGPNMGCVEDAIDKYRGYGIRLQLYYQSPAQMKKCFPNDQDQTVLANCTQVFFAVNDNSAEYVSNRLGEQTIVVESGGTSSGYSRQSSSGSSQGSMSYSRNTNANWNQMSRRLFKPDEILALNERVAITFVPGRHPILTRLERYYEKAKAASVPLIVKTMCVAMFLLFSGTLLLWAAIKNVEINENERSERQPNIHRQADLGRSETDGNARPNGIGERPFQRQRVRSVRPWPVHAGPAKAARQYRPGTEPNATGE